MLTSKAQQTNEHQATHTNSKKLLATACLGLASIFLAAVFMSGCVVHHTGNEDNPGRGHKKGHGHHKDKIKIKPKAEISVSPMIVIDD